MLLADFVTIIVWGMLGIAGISFLVLLAKILLANARRAQRMADLDKPTAIDIPALDRSGPPGGLPRLEVYGTAVRLAIIVVAPVGRDGTLPPTERMSQLVDNLVPGMMAVMNLHQPLFRRWPQQLSTQGFIHSFFNQMPLPGDRGKSTPWCSLAGCFESDGQSYLAGIVCCGHKPNGLSEFTVEHAGQWLDIARVHES